jgi:hypothetical protein
MSGTGSLCDVRGCQNPALERCDACGAALCESHVRRVWDDQNQLIYLCDIPGQPDRHALGQRKGIASLVLVVGAAVVLVGLVWFALAQSWPGSLISRASPNETAEPAPGLSEGGPSPVASPSPPVVMRVGNTDGEGVFLRRTPAMADRIRAYSEGTQLQVIGPDTEGEGRQWRHVRAPDGTEGYVPAEFTIP